MPSYSGVWTLTAQYQAKGANNWPALPGAPTSVSATAGNATATVTFVAPAFVGIPPLTGYLATSTPGSLTASGASSPLTVTGLSNGTAYTFDVQATNGLFGPAGTSGSVTPSAPNAVFAGGGNPNTNNMYYINIASTGNATFFGSLGATDATCYGCASTTRGVFNKNISGSDTNILEYITIATTGNSADFGDLTISTRLGASTNSATRGLFFGGYTGGGPSNVIAYITIASLGNATDFGGLHKKLLVLS